MTKYNFTDVPERIKTNAIKWQKVKQDSEIIPLWIADMDFHVFPAMTEALEEFAKISVFGYDAPKDSLYQAIQDWERTQHQVAVNKEDIVLIEGVVPAISVAIKAFTDKGDAVLINTPVYPPFARSVTLAERLLVTNSLVDNDGHFEIDFDQLEKDLVDNAVKLYIFCSPHNPGGRVWTREEMVKVAELCRKHGVYLVSDEIHQDLALFGNKHHSLLAVSLDYQDFALVLASATKTFNLAGTKNSFALIPNPKLRKAFMDAQLANNQHEVSTLGFLATETALRYGKDWLDELKTVLETNINLLTETLIAQTDIKVMKPEGTYLVWLDFSEYGIDHNELGRILQEDVKLILNDGVTFGKEGEYHFRLNVATPISLLEKALKRLVKAFPKR
ncbi:MalY/PatB family protein [Streptococcus thoraltensis]|uniref:MalY/PatB family protein n=1 Tax=Streptococcus thoraltensis TaxID=55085 RepID=UPI00036DFC42|nr:MalY/PatB family protein [Streptococcus thoraltensis]MDY4761323.1 MalY/PatB family protein [Streptococcus thoraltensis]